MPLEALPRLAAVLVRQLDEEPSAKRCPDTPCHAPMWQASRALEELQVAGSGGIHTSSPSPADDVRARSKRGELDFPP